MGWQQVVEQTVTGLGYELVELERCASGLLRVTIDWPWTPGASGERFITVDDCERVTRQLQYVLEVEGVDYRRLEVGSPGIDRPLRHERDYQRFVGEVVEVTLRQPIGSAAAGSVAPARKHFRGVLKAGSVPGQWALELLPEPAQRGQGARRRPGRDAVSASVPEVVTVLGFALDEVREARLAPVVDFKGRRPRGGATQD